MQKIGSKAYDHLKGTGQINYSASTQRNNMLLKKREKEEREGGKKEALHILKCKDFQNI